MPRSLRYSILAAVALAFAACADGVTTPDRPVSVIGDASAVTCSAPSLATLLSLAGTAFGPGSPDYNSARGKIENLASHVSKGRMTQAVARAHDIVDFVLSRNEQSPLPGGETAVTLLVNAVYCFAGIPIAIDEPGSSRLIFPLDQPQILYDEDSTAAISFPGDPVFEPTLVTITRSDTSQLDLLTKLDRYPGFIRIEQQNAGGTQLKYNVTVTVCAEDVPLDVFPDLRLGHGLGDTVLVITPTPMAGDPPPTPLRCDEPAPALTLGARLFRAAASLLSPNPLHAVVQDTPRRGGGVSGTVSEFSPFEPVDTRLRAGGGVSGTVSEFVRTLPMASLMAEGSVESVLPTDSCDSIRIGTELSPECYPTITVETRNGTKLENVPVDWSIPSGSAGTIAIASGTPENPSCGGFATSLTDATNAAGTSTVCWTAEAVGTQTLVATPRAGGDAPEGVVFIGDGDGFTSFSLVVTHQPLLIASTVPASAPAGSTFTIRVRVVNPDGSPAAGVEVSWKGASNDAQLVSPATSISDADGYATTSWRIALGYNEAWAYLEGQPFDTSVYFAMWGTEPAP